MVSSAKMGFNHGHIKLFKHLLWINTLRGDDSTGIFGIEKSGNVDYMKSTGNASTLLYSTEFDRFESAIFQDFQMVVGHNRKATKGTVTDENAHPFVENTTILVHNGTLTNHATLTDEYISVDSKAILMHMNEHGYEETLKKIQGAFTLVWYDTKDKTLRAIRNNERPLFIASTIGAWFFASEKEMLEFTLGRDNTSIVDMTECVPGTMYSWKLDDIDNMWYKPVDLWSPPKQEKKPQVLLLSPPKKETETTYSNSDFPIDTKLLINPKKIVEFPKLNPQGYTGVIYGTWYFDENILVRCWLTPEELALVNQTIDEDTDEILEIFRAKITCVMSKKDKITLIMTSLEKYIPTLDAFQNEIYEDEFMLTRMQCDDCGRSMNFNDALTGKLQFKAENDYSLFCETCK